MKNIDSQNVRDSNVGATLLAQPQRDIWYGA